MSNIFNLKVSSHYLIPHSWHNIWQLKRSIHTSKLVYLLFGCLFYLDLLCFIYFCCSWSPYRRVHSFNSTWAFILGNLLNSNYSWPPYHLLLCHILFFKSTFVQSNRSYRTISHLQYVPGPPFVLLFFLFWLLTELCVLSRASLGYTISFISNFLNVLGGFAPQTPHQRGFTPLETPCWGTYGSPNPSLVSSFVVTFSFLYMWHSSMKLPHSSEASSRRNTEGASPPQTPPSLRGLPSVGKQLILLLLTL